MTGVQSPRDPGGTTPLTDVSLHGPNIEERLTSVHHDGSRRYVRAMDGADAERLRVGDLVRLRLRAAPEAAVGRVFLRTVPDGEQAFTELHPDAPDAACSWWSVELRISMPSTNYRFLLATDDGHLWLNGSGLHAATPTDRDDFVLLANHDAPGWLADRVFYQIFPDRFANGDPGNDVRDNAWVYRGQATRRRGWHELPERGPDASVQFFGGDLRGIEERLDHLVDLGVNAVYLNPVFDSRSNHGYDITDYRRVADHFGGNGALVSLRRATRERDIRLILDIAPNHIGSEHPWFRAAQADPAGPTADFFVFRSHPDEYESWLGVRSLPKLNYRNEALREAIFAGPDAVIRRWLRPPFEADGWRIDVANMLGRLGPDQLGPEVARGIRQAMKAEAPEAYLVGEHSFDAIDSLSGDEWDGVMNYAGFQAPLLEWLHGFELRSHSSGALFRTRRSTTTAFVQTLTNFGSAIPWSVARRQFNLVGSHDTPRIASLVGGDPGRVRAALAMLLTFVGVPSLLYGDEVGLDGEDDLAARRPMPWDRAAWDLDRLAFVRTLVRLRTTAPALRDGGFQVLERGEDHLAFLRDSEEQSIVAVIVRGPLSRPAGPLAARQGAIPDGVRFREVLTGASAHVTGGCLDLPETQPGAGIWVSVPAGAP